MKVMEPGFDVYPRLIASVTECRKASDFRKVLGPLIEFAGAEGCVIWEIFHNGTAPRRFFKLLDLFPNHSDAPGWFFLPEQCVTGDAIRTGQIRVVDDLRKAIEEGSIPQAEFLLARGIESFCAIPTSFGPKREASVNFYWGKQPRVRGLEELAVAARLIPALNHGVMNQMGFDLLRTVEDRLSSGADELNKVVEAVSESFNAIEASIYLEDPAEAPKVYKCRAKVWPWPHRIKEEIRPGDGGVTAWVLDHNETVRFIDMAHFDEEAASYSGMRWPTRDDILAGAQTKFGEPLPPLGYLGVPIRDRNGVVGVIRCCLAESVPYHFDDRQIQILQLVAGQVGHWWGNRLAIAAAEAESRRFTFLVQGITKLQQLASLSLRDTHRAGMTALWHEALALVSDVLPWREALSIRWVDKEKGDLCYVAHLGDRWNKDGRAAERLATRYSLNGDFAGSRVIRERRVLVEPEAGRPGRARSALFPDAKRIIHGPIQMGREVVGVLDIRGFTEEAVPPHAALICELIGRQLGLFSYLQEQFWKLKTQERKLSEQYEEQTRVYEDFVHQLRNPLVKASILSKSANVKNPAMLQQLRSQVQKASVFADTINVFVSLAKEEPIEAPLSIMEHDHVLTVLRESIRDQESLSEEMEKPLQFVLHEHTFEPLKSISAQFTEHLFLHCLYNLLDNATKYSKLGSQIDVFGRYEPNSSRFVISVSNEGFRILPEERKRLVERGVRGDRARVTTAGGRGLGLWIVNKLMLAMKGDLIVLPTDSRHRNVISLSFGCWKPSNFAEESA